MDKLKFPFILFVVGLVLGLPSARLEGRESRIKFDRILVSHGLSQSSIQVIIQDSRGFMWFGTEDGLNKYDGNRFTVYRNDPENPLTLGDNEIVSLCEDAGGTLWIGTNNGLDCFNREKETFSHFRRDREDKHSLGSSYVTGILEDSAGTLWVGTNGGGLCRMNREKKGRITFTRYLYSEKEKNCIASDTIWVMHESPLQPGVLWVTTFDGLSKLSQNKDGKVVFENFVHDPKDPRSLSQNNLISICEDKDGLLWLGTASGGVCTFDRNSKLFTHYIHNPGDSSSLSSNNACRVFTDADNNIWVGTYSGGLNKFLRGKNEFIHFKNEPLDPQSLSQNDVFSIYQDRSGVMWVGTVVGLNKFSSSSNRFAHYRNAPTDPDSIQSNDVWALYEDSAGSLWAGTVDGLFRMVRNKAGKETFSRSKLMTFGDANGLANGSISAIYEAPSEPGVLWVGSSDGLSRMEINGKKRFTNYKYRKGQPGIASKEVACIFEDRDTDLWVGTLNGLTRMRRDPRDKKKFSFDNYVYIPKDTTSLYGYEIKKIIQDRNGTLWLASDYGISSIYTDKEGKVRFKNYFHDPKKPKGLCNNQVFALCEDRAGILWVGTNQGLNRFDPSTGVFQHYLEKHGLANDVIYGVLEDKKGNLWLSCNKGLMKFNLLTGHIRNYDMQEGVQSNEFNGGVYFKGKSGRMYFGGINGFNAFFPDRLRDNDIIPPIVLTDFQVFTQSAAFGPDLRLTKHINEVSRIVLSHRDYVFSLEFASLDYHIPAKNRYAYMLEGFEDDWNYCGKRRFATYTNLDPGDYVFKVKGTNNDGIWNKNGISIKVRIVPPFWKTHWFRLAMVVFLSGIVFFIYKLRVRNIQQQRVKLQQLVDKRTEELRAANNQLERLAEEDGLTGLYNHRTFIEKLDKECRIAERRKHSVSLIMLDVDFFKIYNDSYGHQAGDECLARLGELLRETVKRPSDFSVRYGGEEFVVVLPDTGLEGAIHVAQGFKKALAEAAIPFDQSCLSDRVTVSMGVSTFLPSDEYTSSILILSADTALYQAKSGGRNRIFVFNTDNAVES
ncbi:MAG: diguanylate cyclase [bacterium]|nr:diguanylate cyclase [bacterium]